MSKTPARELVDQTKEEMVTFLIKGGINERKLSDDLDFLGMEIDDFSRIKQIHFVLSEPVLNFVEALPRRIRRIKRDRQRSSEISRGKIEGKIDWGATMKMRHSQSYGDKSLFVCEKPYVEYDIPENLVLKKLLAIIYGTVSNDIKQIDYDWRTERWGESRVKQIQQIVERNVHVSRIRDAQDIHLRQRDLDTARKSRNELYYKAYDLHTKYSRLMANEFEKEDVRALLDQTLVEPDETYTLFEYFCVFKVIKALREKQEYGDLTIQPVRENSNEIARLESKETKVKVFHDSQGSLVFKESIDDIDEKERPLPSYLQRYEDVIEEHIDTARQTIGRKHADRLLYNGRPDLIVEIYDQTKSGKDRLREALVGEIKYTDKDQTFSKGLKQLLEYMKYARQDEEHNEYLQDMQNKIEGILIVDSVEFNDPDRSDLQVVDANQLMD